MYGLDKNTKFSPRVPADWKFNFQKNHFYKADISKPGHLGRCLQKIDVVIHTAADPRMDAGWDSLFANNILGTYHLFESARCAGVKRVIFGSSMMVLMGYMSEQPYRSICDQSFIGARDEIRRLTHESLPRPTTPYAASKLWGETLARLYAEKNNLSGICLRIGALNSGGSGPKPGFWSSWWCGFPDLFQLVQKSIHADEKLSFDIFYGISDNVWRWVDVDHAKKQIGYTPLPNHSANSGSERSEYSHS